MITLLDAIRTRLLPALVTALGVVLVTAGLLSYVDPATAGTEVPESPVIETLAPSDAPSFSFGLPSASPSPFPGASPSTWPVWSPGASPGASQVPQGRAYVTRVVIPALNIDLPVVKGNDGYPYCNVAMYLTTLTRTTPDHSVSRARGARPTSTRTLATACSARSTSWRSSTTTHRRCSG